MMFIKKMYRWAFIANVILLTTKNDVKVKAHYGDPCWSVTLYYFLGVCIFYCIPLQTFERISQYFLHIMLEYNLGKILEN
jgi:hypothetical protein